MAGPSEQVDAAAWPWGWQDGDPAQFDWVDAVEARGLFTAGAAARPRASEVYGVGGGWQLVPSPLPEMEERPIRFGTIRRTDGIRADDAFLRGQGDLRIPAKAQVSLLLDQRELVSAYLVLRASGGAGANLRITYAEALFAPDGSKGNRDEIDGKNIRGLTDTIRFDGGAGRSFTSTWWRTWRYVQLDITTGDAPLVLHDLHGIFTAYPFEQNASFACDADWIGPIWDINWRVLRLSAFDTFMDTPYYEQLQYIGDTRLEALIALYNSGDDRLVRNAITLFDQSRTPEGITASRYPSAEPQFIPPFALRWVAMLHDYWMHRDDPAIVEQFVRATRGMLSSFEAHVDHSSGMLGVLPWRNFLDWNPNWERGTPPGSVISNSGQLKVQFAQTPERAAQMEDRFGLAVLAR